MEALIPISELNDFIFCPRSIYFHHLYGNFDTDTFHESPQTKGTQAHENIDQKKYSSAKHWIQSIEISSYELGITGKIDLFNEKTGELIERKRTIKTVYDGYVLQILAQAICLVEMGYLVKKCSLYSLTDNKKYNIPFHFESAKIKLQNHITEMKHFDIKKPFSQNPKKCEQCIYRTLCDIPL